MAQKAPPIPYWIPIVIAGILIVIPDPATTLTGLGILAATFGYRLTQ
jgi:hypothetical protein